MRDPDARLRFEGDRVVRDLRTPMKDGHFLRSSLAKRWASEQRMVPYDEISADRIAAERLPFVSQPAEWCDAQLYAAGRLTLDLQEDAVAAGFDLKDASAWNVLFDGVRPVLCDHTSLKPLRSRKWWAAGQFSRQFILPLLLSRKRGVNCFQSFAMWRDGVPPEAAAQLIGLARFTSRYWPLMTSGRELPANSGSDMSKPELTPNVQRFRTSLHASLRWMLQGVAPVRTNRRGSEWSRYVDEREHYGGASLASKLAQLQQWSIELRPAWVLDLGCNSGEFSRLMHAAGAHVVAIDSDHDCVQALFESSATSARLYPIVANLDDLSGGRGWAGTEHEGLAARLTARFDMVLMLALIHHLAIGLAVPLEEIARFAASLSRQWLVIEWVGEHDPQLKRLCAARDRDPSQFSITHQKAAFLANGFSVEAEIELAPANRTLALLKRL